MNWSIEITLVMLEIAYVSAQYKNVSRFEVLQLSVKYDTSYCTTKLIQNSELKRLRYHVSIITEQWKTEMEDILEQQQWHSVKYKCGAEQDQTISLHDLNIFTFTMLWMTTKWKNYFKKWHPSSKICWEIKLWWNRFLLIE